MKTGAHIIFVVQDVFSKKDMIVSVDRNVTGSKENVLYTVTPAYVL